MTFKYSPLGIAPNCSQRETTKASSAKLMMVITDLG